MPTNGDDIAQDNEIGPSNNALFGAAPNRHFDPDSKRPYDIEYTLGVEREVARGLSVGVTWIRKDSYDLQQTVNRAVSSSDYTPPNPLLNGEILTIYNLNRDKQRQVDLWDTGRHYKRREDEAEGAGMDGNEEEMMMKRLPVPVLTAIVLCVAL